MAWLENGETCLLMVSVVRRCSNSLRLNVTSGTRVKDPNTTVTICRNALSFKPHKASPASGKSHSIDTMLPNSLLCRLRPLEHKLAIIGHVIWYPCHRLNVNSLRTENGDRSKNVLNLSEQAIQLVRGKEIIHSHFEHPCCEGELNPTECDDAH